MASGYLALYFLVILLLLLVSLVSGDCIDLDLGIGSGKIPDNNITASSEISEAKNGRLNEIKAWCASTEDAQPYLQIDLETIHIVCAVSTQGNPNADQWIETYTIQVSTNGTTWTDYKELGQFKTFTGNKDRNTENKNIFSEGVLAKTLRFVGQTSHNRFCLRAEIYGVKLKPENLAAGKPTGQSSTCCGGDSEKAVDGNLGTNFSVNSQCAHTQNDNPSWWWVDLGSDVPVSEVFLVNRFSLREDIRQRNKDFNLTLGNRNDVNNPPCNGLYTFIQFIASAVCYRNPLTTGRYLGIKTTKEQILQLCEVEVYSRENLAYQKNTSQSSTVNDQGASGHAVDGNSDTLWNGGSCTHTLNGKQPWWRVDLGNVKLVNEVYVVNRGDCCGNRLNPFEIRVGVNSSNGGITNPKCGDDYRVPQNQGASFFCRPSLYGRYVTIRRPERTDALTLCEVEVYSARRACQIQAIGLASSDAIPDDSFSATNHRSGNEAYKGRLNGNGAWSPSGNDGDDYLQINLKDQFFICAVATQGSSRDDHWTTLYKLSYWLENLNWLTYQENDIDKVFNANDGRNDTVKHSLVGLIRARSIRFQPTAFIGSKALRVEVYGILTTAAPSRAPTNFTVTPSTSTSVHASWQLPTADFQMITGFRLLYRNFSFVEDPLTVITIESNSILTYEVTGLGIFTKYEFQVLAFSIMSDGPSSAVKTVRTNAEAPSQAPTNLSVTINNSTSVSVNWQLPPGISRNGVILGFTLYYRKNGTSGQANTSTVNDGTVLSSTITGLGKFTGYEFQVSAFTYAGEGPRSSVVTERTSEDAPSFGPDTFFTAELNETTFNISWAPLPTEKSNGIVVLYEVNAELVTTRGRSRRAVGSSTGVNTTNTFAVLYDFICSQYSFSVRAFTAVGPGPYGPATKLQTSNSRPAAPRLLKAVMSEETKVTLEWTPPTFFPVESLKYKVKYTGTKHYNSSFLDIGEQDPDEATNSVVENLVPGTQYNFEVNSVSVCGESQPTAAEVTTKMSAPLAPYVGKITDISASKSSAVIQLWPAEQRNGPISAYQVIVLKVADGNENLPPDYDSKLKDSEEASQSNVDFYISAELSNEPVYKTAWEFTVGDGKNYGVYKNTVLQQGEVYIVFQRALTDDQNENVVLKGNHITVAKISVTNDIGKNDASEGSNGTNIVPIVVPVVLLFLLIPAVVIVFIFYRRRKRSKNGGDSKAPIPLDSVGSDMGLDNTVYQTITEVNSPTKPDEVYSNVVVDSPKTKSDEQIYQNTKDGSAGTAAKPVYQNIAGMRKEKDTAQTAKIKEDELVYSEAQDDKPKPVPASKFVAYFKSKAINGAAVLRKEFKELPGGMLSPYEVATNNKSKNRYGNIVTYDHSRVILGKKDGDSKSDYINASYIPTYDEKTMSYIATQGPNKVTVNDFWRMIWQENCLSIVMLTNTVEQGKTKCEKYWPETTSKYGSVTVSLQKTETFADYIIRTFTLLKGSEKREVLQYHYTTWPDRGVPNHAAALLAFRWKVHVRHQMTGGPIVVHCSAGVGRTGTFIGIDAMLESAKKQNSLFIYNYVQVMRRQRPHMVQKDEQYVFLHQSVMVALVCGNTEVSSHDLLIRMNKLARVNKTSKQTGYTEELKCLQIIGDFEGSEEESTVALQPANIKKNRFPDILPLDNGRLILKSSEPDKDYINASFVDDYIRRDAYILTQAPLDKTINDFWRMVSQYDIGTVVMLNSLEEGKEVYPQYWPSKGSTRYGNITLEMLSESTANGITTRKISIANTEPPKKNSTVQHLQFTAWSDPNSCPDPQEILRLLTAVQKSQQQTGNGTIVFQCSDGVGRSGVAATVMSAIEKLKNEQTVDVLQTVNLIRVKRPFAVSNVEQYMLCYKTVHAYLDSFGEYANFSKR